jgi:hypothetical protein
MGRHYDYRKLGTGHRHKQSVWEQVRGLARAYYRRWKRGQK